MIYSTDHTKFFVFFFYFFSYGQMSLSTIYMLFGGSKCVCVAPNNNWFYSRNMCVNLTFDVSVQMTTLTTGSAHTRTHEYIQKYTQTSYLHLHTHNGWQPIVLTVMAQGTTAHCCTRTAVRYANTLTERETSSPVLQPTNHIHETARVCVY